MQGEQDNKGWLLTCDQYKQKQALKDAYNFLTMYIQQVYDDLVSQAIQKKLKQENKQHSLQTELKQCKKKQNRLLFSIDTKVKCVIFVKINDKYKSIIDPVLIVDKMMEDVWLRNKQITRYCHKILPVQRAFKAEHFKMLDVVDQLFNQKTQPNDVKSWSLNFKLRNNSKFNYKQVLRQCEKIATKYGHFADIYYPQWTVSIQIANHLMCISISDKFKQYHQYKLHKTVPKEQRPRKDREEIKEKKQGQQNDDVNGGLMGEEELRKLLAKQKLNIHINNDNDGSNGNKSEQQQQKPNEALSKQLKQEPKDIKHQQIKGSGPNVKLLQQKIQAKQDQDVDLF